jgi:multicomponent Na+:H+ antiporter subunit D
MLSALLLLVLWRWRRWQQAVSTLGAAVLLAAGILLLVRVWQQGILATQMGDWPAPFGITLVADLFSAIMVVLAGLMGFCTAIYSIANISPRREQTGYYVLLHFLLMGVCGALVTGDLFNLYVWFELMLLASFVLIVLGGHRPQLEGGIKYVTLSLLASILLLISVALIYGAAGTLNMADLAVQLPRLDRPGLVTTLAMLLLVAFGIKAAVFPLFFWLPASYHTPPAAVSAIFAGLLTKVGVYALIRVFTLLFTQDVGYTHTILLVIAGLTMISGVLGAISQNDFRRILSFHIISQIGYMVFGLALHSPLAIAGAIFFIAHNIVAKGNLFLVSGLVRRLGGSYRLKRLGGIYGAQPFVALVFLVPALSLAGIPPLSGFWAKLWLVRAGFEQGQYVLVAIALAVSLVTLMSMVKIWVYAFWRPAPARLAGQAPRPLSVGGQLSYLVPIVLLAAVTLAMGLAAGPFAALAERAGQQLFDPSAYIQAVFGR